MTTPVAELTGFVVLILLFTIATARYVIRDKTKLEKFQDQKHPILWWVVDDMEGNARMWLDWGARLLKQPNAPFLSIHLRKVKELHKDTFDVVPLLGRAEVHRVLREHGVNVPAEADIAPGWLWRAWSSAQMVCYVGGLWVDSYSLFLKPITPLLATSKALRFGTDPDEERLGKNGSVGSDTNVLWGFEEGCGLWQSYAQDLNRLMKGGPLSWNAAKIRRAIRYLQDKHLAGQISVERSAEWTRFSNGKAIQLTDLLDRYIEGETELPTDKAYYVPLTNEDLNRKIPTQWFLRMSEKQLLNSEFLWSQLAKRQIVGTHRLSLPLVQEMNVE